MVALEAEEAAPRLGAPRCRSCGARCRSCRTRSASSWRRRRADRSSRSRAPSRSWACASDTWRPRASPSSRACRALLAGTRRRTTASSTARRAGPRSSSRAAASRSSSGSGRSEDDDHDREARLSLSYYAEKLKGPGLSAVYVHDEMPGRLLEKVSAFPIAPVPLSARVLSGRRGLRRAGRGPAGAAGGVCRRGGRHSERGWNFARRPFQDDRPVWAATARPRARRARAPGREPASGRDVSPRRRRHPRADRHARGAAARGRGARAGGAVGAVLVPRLRPGRGEPRPRADRRRAPLLLDHAARAPRAHASARSASRTSSPASTRTERSRSTCSSSARAPRASCGRSPPCRRTRRSRRSS